VDNRGKIFREIGLWITEKFIHIPCGKKVVAALRENRLIHITFLY
jgi:hypothetical protein